MNAVSHRQQINSEKGQSLLRAGIGLDYHKRSLSEFPEGTELLSWVNEAARADVQSGIGWSLYGEGFKSYEVTMLLARALHLSGVPCRVVSLARLSRWVAVDAEELEPCRSCGALFVLGFWQNYAKGLVPLTGREIMDVEDFLAERLDNKRAVFPQTMERLSSEGWWSGALVQRVAKNRQMRVGA